MNSSFFVQMHDLPDYCHPVYSSLNRSLQFYASRKALLFSIEDHLNKKIEHHFDKLEIINHHYLKQYPNIVVSLSHTQNIGAALCASRNEYQSVGIDIELKTRKVKEGALKFYSHKKDDLSLNHLQLWVAKEACFKAISPHFDSFEGEITLSKIWVNNFQFGLVDQVLGHFTLSEEVIGQHKIVVAKSFIKTIGP
ncbi:MAG: hypothetical protein H6622_10035 [Halobacteriovoraceae bacterium]|nr:hypothetical protein [Halobacteriovoraceae bacterium]